MLDLNDLNMEKTYAQWRAYGTSKLACHLFALQLSQRLTGTGVSINLTHPGAVATGLPRNLPLWQKAILYTIFYPLLKTPSRGAAATIYAITNTSAHDAMNQYYIAMPFGDEVRVTQPAPAAANEDDASALWILTETVTVSAWFRILLLARRQDE